MHIAKGVHKIPRFEPADLSHHHGQQSIRSDVEGNSQEHIGAALIELAGDPPVVDPELKKGVNSLYIAISRGDTKTAHMLLDKGANPDIKDKNGTTALMIVILSNSGCCQK